MAFKTSLLFLRFLIKAQIICFATNPLRQIFTHVSIVIFVVSFRMLTAIVICFLYEQLYFVSDCYNLTFAYGAKSIIVFVFYFFYTYVLYTISFTVLNCTCHFFLVYFLLNECDFLKMKTLPRVRPKLLMFWN